MSVISEPVTKVVSNILQLSDQASKFSFATSETKRDC